MDFNELRGRHKQFIYEGFEINKEESELKIHFDFTITPDIKFKPEKIFPSGFKELNEGMLNNLVFHLGLVEMISYWKATCSPEIIIKAGYLDDDQISWWKGLLIKGLGEFFYVNQIDFTQDGLVSIRVESDQHYPIHEGDLQDRDLILVGGGKDSAVTLEYLWNEENQCLLLNPTEAAKNIAKVVGCSSPLIIKRTIDPKLLKLNEQGYLNGHAPFSAYLAFLSTVAAVLYDYQNIVVSNEASSSEGNIEYRGQVVNHQYSKGLEFEQNFRDYSKKYLSTQSHYYSFLRDLNELQIARLFSKMDKYHPIFRSCNVGSKKGGIWCGECSKCLFAYLMLYPFLGDKLKDIFGKDLLNDDSLAGVMEELLQFPGKFKPFECVGTKEEIKYAIFLGILKLKGQNLPKLLEKFQDHISILILGMGREGQATLEFLQKFFPANQIETTDQKDGDNYLDKLANSDIIIKSPGIPNLPEIKKAQEDGKIISSITDIFFSLVQGQIIGVTGTKGKSTTASLIYGVLKSAGLDVYLIGNIGSPALEYMEKDAPGAIFVYELSSFQLEDLKISPHIGVITNFYPEHLDHHGSVNAYLEAKTNITKFQTSKDCLIYNQETAAEIAEHSRAQKIPISKNTEAVVAVAKLFDISEQRVQQVISNFKGLPHRLEFTGEFKGINFYNDSLSTIPQATIYALAKLGDDVQTLIAGGFDRGIDYDILGSAITKSKVKNLILFPDTGEKIRQAVEKARGSAQKFDVNSMEEAVKLAFEKTSPGKIVLLSPASASFNLFKDYADRGDQFKKLVQEYRYTSFQLKCKFKQG